MNQSTVIALSRPKWQRLLQRVQTVVIETLVHTRTTAMTKNEDKKKLKARACSGIRQQYILQKLYSALDEMIPSFLSLSPE